MTIYSFFIYMTRFQKTFGDIIPLRQIPVATTTEQLITAIKECLEKGETFFQSSLGTVIREMSFID